MSETRSSPRGRRPKVGTNPIDIHVGGRVRLRRTLLGLSQSVLGEKVGLTFQQIQKYERGANRISASMLHELSTALDVPVSFFFDDLPADSEPGVTAMATETEHGDPMAKRETLELVRAYYRIPDPVMRKRMVDLIRAIADNASTELER